MKKQTVIPRKKRGPPATGKGEPVVVRMHPPMLAGLDDWIAKQKQPFPSRPEAVRRLIELGLTVRTPAKLVSKRGRNLRAHELASNTIEKMIDPAASPEERVQRRRRLTKGPSEFRDHRIDLPKAKGK
jgi:Arc/MetJ-type ribon-helix-helix transcriptional regulator